MDDEAQVERERQRAIAGIVGGLLSLATVLLAVYPEAPEQAAYSIRLWLAHRERTNWARMRYERRKAEATGQTADRVIPA